MFVGSGTNAVFWTSNGSGSDGTGSYAVYVEFAYDNAIAEIGSFLKKSRVSVRCIKNVEKTNANLIKI